MACTGEAARVQPAQHRQGKGCGLAAAGLGLGDEVVTGQRQRQTGGLDWRHRAVFELTQVVEQGGGSGRCRKESKAAGSAAGDRGGVISVMPDYPACRRFRGKESCERAGDLCAACADPDFDGGGAR